ncbi:MAG TPA: hypothetical protein VFG98_03555 [Intrasporangium sp.]|nr:hypothetical protein [Intrasporangium sp.]
MNLISKTTSAIIHPVQTATSVAGQAMGVAAAGARTTMRIIGRAAGQVRRGSPDVWSATDPAATPDATPDATETGATPGATLVEPAARKAPATKASATKAPAKKGAAKKAPSARAATVAPALSRNVQDGAGDDDVRTPSGIPAADEGYNPDTAETDLHQPGTEPLMDPATVKAIKSEAEVMQRAADPDKS